ncbi:MAG: DUF2779 domain-containing protein [Burkholderiales bacterium]|nr:DUF2779 domain-containing protein [Burkholderiales bacterium]
MPTPVPAAPLLPPPRLLSKSRLLSWRQCAKRLWFEARQPELAKVTAATEAAFTVGHEVGTIARSLYDPAGKGRLLDVEAEGVNGAIKRTLELLRDRKPIFEAGFATDRARAFADILLPVTRGGKPAWRMIEVKSSASIKDYHHDDAAIQANIARAAGLPLAQISIAHLDTGWRYPGNGDYRGLLVEHDLSRAAFERGDEVDGWLSAAHRIVRQRTPPKITTGGHCNDPYPCAFLEHCSAQEPQAEFPVTWLPRVQTKTLKAHLADGTVTDLRQVDDSLLNERQLRVKRHTLSGKAYFDKVGAAAALAAHPLPAWFLDFETIQFPVPIWKGTRPYQIIPFQFSVHRFGRNGRLAHTPFLDLSGGDPSRPLAEALVAACGERGPVFVYNAAFEKTRIRELATRFPALRRALLAIEARIVDLRPIAEAHYYHPSQEGSWSLKVVLPPLAPDLRHDTLDGVQDGALAMDAYREALAPDTARARKAEIERQLLAYCERDTFALVRLWKHFSGRQPGVR